MVLPKENHMQSTEAATLDRKSGVAEGSAVRPSAFPNSPWGPLRRGYETDSRKPLHSEVVRRRNAFAITETELKLIAAAAIIGLSSNPNTGKSTPAASGTPNAL